MLTFSRASLHVGSYLPDDATGNSLWAKHEVLCGQGIRSRIYCQEDHSGAEAVRRVKGEWAPLPEWWHLWRSGLHVFEYGFFFSHFEWLRWLPAAACKLVYFHGVPPVEDLTELEIERLRPSREQYRLANHATAILHATEYSAELSRSLGVTVPEYRLLPLPVDLPEVNEHPSAGGPLRLLFVGRMQQSKGLHLVLEVLRELRAEGFPEWRLAVIFNPLTADADYLERLERFRREEGLESQIEWVGRVSCRNEMAKWYATADATVIPTRHETYCLPLLESLWSGTLVLAHAVGAIPEVASGLANLIASGDRAGWARALKELAVAKAGVNATEAARNKRLTNLDTYRRILGDRSREAFQANFQNILDEWVEDRGIRRSLP